MNKAYLSLERHFARLSSLNDALGILGWDKEVIMPSGAAERRAENLAMLEGLRHEILTAPIMADLLAEADAGDDVWRTANLEQMRRQHTQATALPGELVEASAQATARCEMAWRTRARKVILKALSHIWPKCCA